MIKIFDTKIGTKLEIELVDSLGGKIGGTYTSQLLDIKDSNNITIAAPIQESRLMLIPSGSRVRCIFIHHKHGLISFLGTVTSKEKQGNVIAINLNINGRFSKIQRRNHFRLEHTIEVKYKLLSKEQLATENDSCEDNDYTKGYTKNISGCGACVIADEPIEKGNHIQLILATGNGLCIETKGLIVRCIQLDDVKPVKYGIGISFVNILPKDQDALVRFIFDKQKQILKRKA